MGSGALTLVGLEGPADKPPGVSALSPEATEGSEGLTSFWIWSCWGKRQADDSPAAQQEAEPQCRRAHTGTIPLPSACTLAGDGEARAEQCHPEATVPRRHEGVDGHEPHRAPSPEQGRERGAPSPEPRAGPRAPSTEPRAPSRAESAGHRAPSTDQSPEHRAPSTDQSTEHRAPSTEPRAGPRARGTEHQAPSRAESTEPRAGPRAPSPEHRAPSRAKSAGHQAPSPEQGRERGDGPQCQERD
ncbi:PREDICTED: serine/arginine repetitive matrix protein 1-like [Dipodomys ordii]|uniref:Serine/arginine repetitive matrix protein 1-like n=1 Tax=Dipodomys ordii TaxID=10020 RepID=A0A1S3FRL0_DIPOR|nr:PREDICTED: serine/arginine repetitive matrix protein 1-like [Dipodomys ordii]